MFLTKSNFTQGKAVSLIGFSLGTVVLFNMNRVLKRLYREGNKRAALVINDMQLWAGAYVIGKTQAESMRGAYQCAVVNGQLSNLHSDLDYVLSKLFTTLQPGAPAIGSYEIFTDVKDDPEGIEEYKKAFNLQVEKEAGGHLGYKAGCLEFLGNVPYSY